MTLLTTDLKDAASVRPKSRPMALPEFQEFLCGWGAAFINIGITYPINKVMFRQMLHGVNAYRAIDELRKEGYKYLYRGVLPPLAQKTGSVALMFGMYDQYQKMLLAVCPTVPHVMVWTLAALMAGTTEAILTPFERIQTLMQDRLYHERFQNSLHAAQVLRNYGLKEYYRGLTPILMRNGPSNIMFFGIREEVRHFFPETKYILGQLAADFVSGAVVGAFISTVTYPINVVKTHMQSMVGGKFVSFIVTFNVVFNERGRSWRRMFYGVHVNYTRALLSWGIINASYEMLKKVFFNSAVS